MSKELNAEVAEKIFGYEFDDRGKLSLKSDSGVLKQMDARTYWIPNYSTEIKEAMTVFDKVGLECEIKGPCPWEITLYHITAGEPEYKAVGETLPEAICKAALASVKGK